MAETMASSRENNNRSLHAIAIPYPVQGHINPLLQLCQLLVPHGFTFTFVVSNHIYNRLVEANPLSSALAGISSSSSSSSPIRVVSVDGGVAPEVHAYRDKKVDPFVLSRRMMAPVEELLASMQRRPCQEAGSSRGVDFILADVLLDWSLGLTAPKFGLPSVAFWCASATTCSILLHFADLFRADAAAGKAAAAAISAGEGGAYAGIPGLPPMEAHYITRFWDEEGKPRETVLSMFGEMRKARLLVLNTFPELEESCIEALSQKMETVAVGPLISAEMAPATASLQRRLNLFREDEKCLVWLDRQAPGSVLFVSFGSISVRPAAEMAELSAALNMGGGAAAEEAAPPYLWVCRPAVEGVKEYVRDSEGRSESFSPWAENGKGMVVGWAPQMAVLRHPAVGGFLTHCGWNSVLESVACGVPMLCWADTHERMSVQRLVVDVWGCGADLLPDRPSAVAAQLHHNHNHNNNNNNNGAASSSSFVDAQHLRRVIAHFMGDGQLRNRLRLRAAELKAVSSNAMHRSSIRLLELARQLLQHASS